MQARTGVLVAALSRSTPALRSGGIRRVSLAYLAFRTVEMAAWTAILVYAYGATGPASIGLVAAFQLVPSALAAPLLAGIGDRYRPDRLLVGWYLVEAAAVALVGMAIVAGSAPLLVYVLSAIATVVLTQTRPVQAALLPRLAATPEELTSANALLSVADGLGAFAGPLVVALLAGLASIGMAFIAGGVALAAGALVLLSIRSTVGAGVVPGGEPARAAVDRPVRSSAADGDAAHPAEWLAGLRLVASDRDTFIVVALLTARLAIYGGLEVLVVLLAIDLLGAGSGAGVLLAAVGLGTIVGGVSAFGLVGRRRLAPWLGVGAVAIGVPVALIGLVPASALAAVLLVVCGVGLATMDVAGQTLLQRITPDGLRARVFGLLEGLLLIGEAAGSSVVGPFAVLVGVPMAAVVLGLALPAAAALALGRFAEIDRRATVPVAELEALRRVPTFMPLGPVALEGAARRLRPIHLPASTAVIRQGEIGDLWYLVRTGRLAVDVGGRVLAELGPGDGFGEIALLHDVPRTATVTALTDVSLWALGREEFLAAVTGVPSAVAEAERLAAQRIAEQGESPTQDEPSG